MSVPADHESVHQKLITDIDVNFAYVIAVSLFSTAFVQVLAQDLTTPTFYFSATGQNPHSRCPTVQTFQDGNVYGPCGNRYGPQSKYWAAIRDGGAHCGESIVMTYGTNSITLTVQDSCPGCSGDNHVDMGIEALVELTGSPEAACAIDRAPVQVQWRFGSEREYSPQPQEQNPVFSPNSNAAQDQQKNGGSQGGRSSNTSPSQVPQGIRSFKNATSQAKAVAAPSQVPHGPGQPSNADSQSTHAQQVSKASPPAATA